MLSKLIPTEIKYIELNKSKARILEKCTMNIFKRQSIWFAYIFSFDLSNMDFEEHNFGLLFNRVTL